MVTTRSRQGLVEIDTGTERGWWQAEQGALRAALADYYGGLIRGEALTPPADPALLRAGLRRVAPGLAAIANQIRGAFDAGSCAVVVARLGLAGVEVDQRRQAVFALAVLLGDVTANLPFEHVVWDVKDRMDERAGRIKFSESARRAFYHTDNGSLTVPENYFLLYAVRAAECGGGVSLIRDIRTITAQLAQTPHGRAAIRTLTDTNIPKQIPSKFWKYAEVSPDGCQYTPILAERPAVRWRRGGIRRALAAHPECATPAVRQALELFIDQLENGDGEIRLLIPSDGLLVVDNHTALHGRTAFTDSQRHLLRLRLHPPSLD
jgi:hypothetical protein